MKKRKDGPHNTWSSVEFKLRAEKVHKNDQRHMRDVEHKLAVTDWRILMRENLYRSLDWSLCVMTWVFLSLLPYFTNAMSNYGIPRTKKHSKIHIELYTSHPWPKTIYWILLIIDSYANLFPQSSFRLWNIYNIPFYKRAFLLSR